MLVYSRAWDSTSPSPAARPRIAEARNASKQKTVRILFVTMTTIQQGPSGPTSAHASARYRVLIPAHQLLRLGHEVQIAAVAPGQLTQAVKDMACDVLIVSKSFDPDHVDLVQAMRSRGAKVIVDFCDDHFAHPDYGPHFRKMAGLADRVVASTGKMAESLREHAKVEAAVITDPVEGPRGLPRFSPQFPALRVVWFGHPSNLGGLAAKAGELRRLAARIPVQLSVVTTPTPQAAKAAADIAALDPERIRAQVVAWSLEATWKALEQCDVAWIPVLESEHTAAKSPNRLTESLWAGRLVVADPVPAYMPFADLVAIGAGLEKAVMDALEDPGRVERNLREAQKRIARVHSAFECGRRWAEVAGDTLARPMRLNLGCGDKILPGYVNVDVVQSRAGARPDIVCDLHDLSPLADNSADEVLSVHVVEHFWRWEIRDVLREWVRVLKPGGRMIIECPNIESACRTFLENPGQFSREDKNGQRTMWVFYGDPAWKDPLMIHRWGYTPESLRELLGEVGLAEVHQEPAQFKLREPRDMRIVGTKP